MLNTKWKWMSGIQNFVLILAAVFFFDPAAHASGKWKCDSVYREHRHPNGGGWVSNCAKVDETAFVGNGSTVGGSAVISAGVRIVNSYVGGESVIAAGTKIENSKLHNAKVGNGTYIDNSDIDNSEVGNSVKLDNSVLSLHSKIGSQSDVDNVKMTNSVLGIHVELDNSTLTDSILASGVFLDNSELKNVKIGEEASVDNSKLKDRILPAGIMMDENKELLGPEAELFFTMKRKPVPELRSITDSTERKILDMSYPLTPSLCGGSSGGCDRVESKVGGINAP